MTYSIPSIFQIHKICQILILVFSDDDDKKNADIYIKKITRNTSLSELQKIVLMKTIHIFRKTHNISNN